VYATTAADPYESSYACYYDKKRGVYLGDVYSVKWMENSDAVCIIAPMSEKSYDLHLIPKWLVPLKPPGGLRYKKDRVACHTF